MGGVSRGRRTRTFGCGDRHIGDRTGGSAQPAARPQVPEELAQTEAMTTATRPHQQVAGRGALTGESHRPRSSAIGCRPSSPGARRRRLGTAGGIIQLSAPFVMAPKIVRPSLRGGGAVRIPAQKPRKALGADLPCCASRRRVQPLDFR